MLSSCCIMTLANYKVAKQLGVFPHSDIKRPSIQNSW